MNFAIGKIAFASEQDFEDAEIFLKNKTFSQGMEFVNQKREQEFIILDQAIEQEVIEFAPLAKLEQEVDSFMAQIKSLTSAFVFQKQDLQDFAREYIEAEIGETRKIQDTSLNLDWDFMNINLAGDDIELKIEMDCLTFVDLPKEELEKAITGKDFDEVPRILASNPEIRMAIVKTKPFYMKKAPVDIDSIEIVDKF